MVFANDNTPNSTAQMNAGWCYSRNCLMSRYLVSCVRVQLHFQHLVPAGTTHPYEYAYDLNITFKSTSNDRTWSSANQSHIWPGSTGSSSGPDPSEPWAVKISLLKRSNDTLFSAFSSPCKYSNRLTSLIHFNHVILTAILTTHVSSPR